MDHPLYARFIDALRKVRRKDRSAVARDLCQLLDSYKPADNELIMLRLAEHTPPQTLEMFARAFRERIGNPNWPKKRIAVVCGEVDVRGYTPDNLRRWVSYLMRFLRSPWTPEKQYKLDELREKYRHFDSDHGEWLALEKEEAMNFNGSGMTYFMDLGLTPQQAAKCGEQAAIVDKLNQRLADDALIGVKGLQRQLVEEQRDNAAKAIENMLAKAQPQPT